MRFLNAYLGQLLSNFGKNDHNYHLRINYYSRTHPKIIIIHLQDVNSLIILVQF